MSVEHVANTNGEGRFWLTCNDETFAELPADAREGDPERVRVWMQTAMREHLATKHPEQPG